MAKLGTKLQSQIQRLVAIYEAGKLVPFLGAGMSIPACPPWGIFVQNLEKIAGLPAQNGDLLQRSFEAIRRLRRRDGQQFHQAIQKALTDGFKEPPHKTKILASIYWPLVITTNYDDLFVSAAEEAIKADNLPESYSVLGRSAIHCSRVLSSLHEPAEPILWALHGFLGGQGKTLAAEDIKK